jgi:hypothetical protein
VGLMNLVGGRRIAGQKQAISSEESEHERGNSDTQAEALKSWNIESTTPLNSLGWAHIESEKRQNAQTYAESVAEIAIKPIYSSIQILTPCTV